MADLGNLNFGIHLKDYTPQEYEAIKKKLVNMHATVSARVGLKTDVKEIEDKVEALLKNKTYKVKLELDSESIKKLSDTFRGQGVSTSELRAMRGVSQIMRADAYANISNGTSLFSTNYSE
jgi:glycine cleavage system regulatory protein